MSILLPASHTFAFQMAQPQPVTSKQPRCASLGAASPELVLEVLNKLSNATFLALWLFRWAKKQTRFKHTTETFHILIESLGNIRQFKMIWTLVNDMKPKIVDF
ncbi:Pentatricopeptide repeat-containing protein, mitochondrial, partial [Mucuna pruriens]